MCTWKLLVFILLAWLMRCYVTPVLQSAQALRLLSAKVAWYCRQASTLIAGKKLKLNLYSRVYPTLSETYLLLLFLYSLNLQVPLRQRDFTHGRYVDNHPHYTTEWLKVNMDWSLWYNQLHRKGFFYRSWRYTQTRNSADVLKPEWSFPCS
jgi:hypothetical protein